MEWLDLIDWRIAAVTLLAVAVVQFLIPKVRPLLLAGSLRLLAAALTLLAVAAAADLMLDARSDAGRRALQARAAEISARALVPGSPLACLDSQAGEPVEIACERTVFGRPEIAAAAVAYTEARLNLLADGLAYAGDGGAFDQLILGLRRSIELDRYGFAAQVLAARDGCSAEQCPAFALVGDATALRANLKARAYDTYVARYAAGWSKEDAAPAVADAAPKATKPDEPNPPPPFATRYDFPSSASIPPVSIMNAEPPRAQAEPAAAAAAPPAEAEAPLPPRRPQTQGATTR
jgi:hypothetical protein